MDNFSHLVQWLHQFLSLLQEEWSLFLSRVSLSKPWLWSPVEYPIRVCLQDSTLARPSFPKHSSESLICSRCMPCNLHSGLRINGHLKALNLSIWTMSFTQLSWRFFDQMSFPRRFERCGKQDKSSNHWLSGRVSSLAIYFEMAVLFQYAQATGEPRQRFHSL